MTTLYRAAISDPGVKTRDPPKKSNTHHEFEDPTQKFQTRVPNRSTNSSHPLNISGPGSLFAPVSSVQRSFPRVRVSRE